jgi:branched-chain amino acid transport system ATP-binding protein
MTDPILQVRGLTKKFGSLVAVNDVSFEIGEGEVVGLIGPNGAGKTTLFNILTGLYAPDEGQVLFRGQDITGMYPHRICSLGMSRTFQVTKAFGSMTVEEAVRVGAYNRHGEREVDAKVGEIIEFFHMEEMRGVLCSDLGLAPLKRVELARAMATEPFLLLLDEAGAGLNAKEMSELMGLISVLRKERNVTLCIVEHVMQMVMGLCERIVVLDYGVLIAEGTPREIGDNEKVIEAYLGKRAVT